MDSALNNLQRLICYKTQPTNRPTILWIENIDTGSIRKYCQSKIFISTESNKNIVSRKYLLSLYAIINIVSLKIFTLTGSNKKYFNRKYLHWIQGKNIETHWNHTACLFCF